MSIKNRILYIWICIKSFFITIIKITNKENMMEKYRSHELEQLDSNIGSIPGGSILGGRLLMEGISLNTFKKIKDNFDGMVGLDTLIQVGTCNDGLTAFLEKYGNEKINIKKLVSDIKKSKLKTNIKGEYIDFLKKVKIYLTKTHIDTKLKLLNELYN